METEMETKIVKIELSHECQICFENTPIELECGHKLCLQCCIKHFRRNESCPYCRKIIYPNEDRTKEYETAIYNEMYCEYTYDDEKSMDMNKYLKSKGMKKKDRIEIIDSIVDRCLEVCKLMENYTSYDSDNESDNESDEDSDSVNSSDYETVSDSDSDNDDNTHTHNEKSKHTKKVI
jgi:hypothetical protein